MKQCKRIAELSLAQDKVFRGLIVDDEPWVGSVLQEFCELAPELSVDLCYNGLEAVEKAKEFAGELGSVRVINGSASEGDILTECGMEVADVFIAASDNDHSNLISAVLAKKMGAKITIIITQQADYMPLIGVLDIDAIINPHHIAVEQILHLVRGKGISAVTKLLECDAEAIEFIPEKDSPVTKDVIKKAEKIIAVSENTKKDLIKLYEADSEKISVVHHGVFIPEKIKSDSEKEKYILLKHLSI